MKLWVQCPGLYKPVFVAQNCDPRTYEAETGKGEVQGHHWLHSKFKVSMNLSQKIKNKQTNRSNNNEGKYFMKKNVYCVAYIP